MSPSSPLEQLGYPLFFAVDADLDGDESRSAAALDNELIERPFHVEQPLVAD